MPSLVTQAVSAVIVGNFLTFLHCYQIEQAFCHNAKFVRNLRQTRLSAQISGSTTKLDFLAYAQTQLSVVSSCASFPSVGFR
jgi:hypothetical protein